MVPLIRLGNFVLDTLFPIECLGCGKEKEWLCSRCAEKIPIEIADVCFVCKKLSFGGVTCFPCRKICGLTGVIRFLDYDYPLIQAALRVIKYGYVKNALWPLLDALSPHILLKVEKLDLDPRAAIFTPVPLHPRKLRERGFNQSELIAEYIASVCDAQAHSLLMRRFYRPPQVLLDETDRVKNIKNTFKCIQPEQVRGQYVVLVDDVATTGSTLNECAIVLREAGAREVWGLVLAKG